MTLIGFGGYTVKEFVDDPTCAGGNIYVDGFCEENVCPAG